jgi:hypothetical protein
MNAKINEKSYIEICPQELIESLDPESKIKFIETLACDRDIIRHVVSQILDNWTENGYSGGKFVTAVAEPTENYGLDWACRQVAKRSSKVAEHEIIRLENALKYKEQEYFELTKRLDERKNNY